MDECIGDHVVGWIEDGRGLVVLFLTTEAYKGCAMSPHLSGKEPELVSKAKQFRL